jgi:hypothetical protein
MRNESWRQRPWAIVLLVLLAIAFGGQLMIGGPILGIVGCGLLLFGWTAGLIVSLRNRKSSG